MKRITKAQRADQATFRRLAIELLGGEEGELETAAGPLAFSVDSDPSIFLGVNYFQFRDRDRMRSHFQLTRAGHAHFAFPDYINAKWNLYHDFGTTPEQALERLKHWLARVSTVLPETIAK